MIKLFGVMSGFSKVFKTVCLVDQYANAVKALAGLGIGWTLAQKLVRKKLVIIRNDLGQKVSLQTPIPLNCSLQFLTPITLKNSKTFSSNTTSINLLIQQMTIFQNQNIIILNKKEGIVVQGDRLVKNSLYKMLVNKYGRIYVVHRLDKKVTGIVMMAKNKETAQILTKKLQTRNITKLYLARCRKLPDYSTGQINIPIMQHSLKSRLCKLQQYTIGRSALTHYKLYQIETLQDVYSTQNMTQQDYQRVKKEQIYAGRIVIRIFDGRKHQIRCHMSGIGVPIIGDKIYGDFQDLQRIYLHCFYIKTQGQQLNKIFQSDTYSKTKQSYLSFNNNTLQIQSMPCWLIRIPQNLISYMDK